MLAGGSDKGNLSPASTPMLAPRRETWGVLVKLLKMFGAFGQEVLKMFHRESGAAVQSNQVLALVHIGDGYKILRVISNPHFIASSVTI